MGVGAAEPRLREGRAAGAGVRDRPFRSGYGPVAAKTSVRFAVLPLLVCTKKGTNVLPMLARPS